MYLPSLGYDSHCIPNVLKSLTGGKKSMKVIK